ncbi:MAG: 16S rRNA (adenine(1518)-N(6)/adenine(1519)-N(6))-dimethyltransferase RsmA [Bacteroidales bacterium]
MKAVKAKKHFGQHFLKDKNIALKIVDALKLNVDNIIEIGPGMGILSEFLFEKFTNCHFIEIDEESVNYLNNKIPGIGDKIIKADFLKVDLAADFKGKLAIIGNFPYNISSQIVFKILGHKEMIPEMVGMFQKEVAKRIASPPGNKDYGILSVLVQAYYNTEILFDLGPECFSPPPKVHSAVLRLERNKTEKLDCNEKLFVSVVKHTFNQRRKMIRNSIKTISGGGLLESEYLEMRPEQLGVEDFVKLTQQLEFVNLKN